MYLQLIQDAKYHAFQDFLCLQEEQNLILILNDK